MDRVAHCDGLDRDFGHHRQLFAPVLGPTALRRRSRVTAELIVQALKVLLPPELLFLISDRGIIFGPPLFAP